MERYRVHTVVETKLYTTVVRIRPGHWRTTHILPPNIPLMLEIPWGAPRSYRSELNVSRCENNLTENILVYNTPVSARTPVRYVRDPSTTIFVVAQERESFQEGYPRT